MHCLKAQILPKKQIQLIAGRSVHGTGDMVGLTFHTEYAEYFKKRFCWTIGLGGTIHDGSFPVFFNDPSGNQIDGSIRYTTAGVQTTSFLGYDLITTSEHEFQIRLGALLRYQSSSISDEMSVYYPLATGLPIPVNAFVNHTPQKTFALGGSTQILYNYTINQKVSIGFLTGFQIDTNGDTISQISLTIGKRF